MKNFILSLDDLGNQEQGNIETLFAQANGFLGVRASLPIPVRASNPGSFVNGYYETHPIIYGEAAYGYAKNHETIVKLFDFKSMEIKIGEEKLTKLMQQSIECDLKNGVLHECYEYTTVSGLQARLEIESFASHANRNVYAQKIKISPLNFSGPIEIKKKAKLIQPTGNAEFDPRVREASTKLLVNANQIVTPNSSLSLFTAFDSIDTKVQLDKNENYEFTQIYQMARQNHFEPVEYEQLKAEQEVIFAEFWDKSDIQIEGDEELQKGIRVNLYHLFNSAGRDGKTNFAAKGLTGEGYEGHYFWDTEMYLLPFFIYTQPEIAKELLSYRLSILPQALERAKELDFDGALFAWRTQSGNETSAYYPAGTAQLHINGDIAYAFQLYDQVTGDEEFIAKSREVIYNTARFWLSYGFMSKRGFEIHEVTGPDEYTALVNNNYYTNKMAQNNLAYASELAERFSEHLYERENWKNASEAMFFGYDEARKLTKQDDSFLDKEPWPFNETPKENYPLLLHYHPMKIYKHQVLKQADTILAHMIYPEPEEQIKRDFDFYEPLTTHDSSLSRAIHGVVASRLGRPNEAYRFFADSATMDLSDMQGNAAHGIHAANMGGSWLGLVYGFAGLQIEGNELKFKNHLPEQITRLSFKVQFQGKSYHVDFKKQ